MPASKTQLQKILAGDRQGDSTNKLRKPSPGPAGVIFTKFRHVSRLNGRALTGGIQTRRHCHSKVGHLTPYRGHVELQFLSCILLCIHDIQCKQFAYVYAPARSTTNRHLLERLSNQGSHSYRQLFPVSHNHSGNLINDRDSPRSQSIPLSPNLHSCHAQKSHD